VVQEIWARRGFTNSLRVTNVIDSVAVAGLNRVVVEGADGYTVRKVLSMLLCKHVYLVIRLPGCRGSG
jgi:hypothetical protein